MTNKRSNRFYGWAVLGGTALRYFSQAGPLYFSFAVFLPTISAEFGWTRTALSGVISLRGVLMGLIGPIAGILIFKYGGKKILAYGAIIGTLGLAAMYTIQEVWHIYLLYGIVVGGSLGIGTLAPLAVINNWFVRRRALAMAIALLGAGTSGLVFPPLIAWFIEIVDWRFTFLILAAIFLVLGGIVSNLIIKNKPEDIGQLPDGIATENNERMMKAVSPLRVYQTPVDWEVKQAMKQPATWIIILSGIASGFATATMQTHQVAYLEDSGYSSMIAASALGIIPALAMVGQLIIGALSTRVEVRYLAIICAIIRVTAVVILLNATSLLLVYLYSALLGLAFGGAVVIRPAFTGSYYGRTHYAQIEGWMTIFSYASTAFAPILAGAIYDATGTYQRAFIVILILSMLGGVGYFFARPPKPPADSPHQR